MRNRAGVVGKQGHVVVTAVDTIPNLQSGYIDTLAIAGSSGVESIAATRNGVTGKHGTAGHTDTAVGAGAAVIGFSHRTHGQG